MKTSILAALVPMLLLQGCAPAGPGSSEAPSEAAAPATATSRADDGDSSATATAPAASSAAPVDTRVKDSCHALCDRVKKSCPEGRDESCLAQCPKVEAKSKGCEAEAEAAFTCQLNAKESFCDSLVASGCVDAFKRLQSCQRGEKQAPVAGGKLPDDWKRVEDKEWGVSILMPPGAAVDAQAKSRTWRASRGGAAYEVIELARPKKLDQQSMIKLVIAHLGVSCQKEMRLTGLVETDKVTSTRFETTCSAGSRRYGKLWIDQQRVLSMVVRDEGEGAMRDAFLDSIK